jgi:hypothetical protein
VETESELADAWVRGTAANVAAPADVLLRLLGPAGRAAWEVLCGGRALPEEVAAAIVAGSEVAQRRLLARNPHATPEQRGRLALDPDAMVRCDVATGPKRGTWLVRPLPRFELPADVRGELEQDPDADVRTTAAAFGAATTRIQYGALYRIATESVLREAERHASLSDFGDPDWFIQAAESDNVLLRRASALHPRLPPAQVGRLAADCDEEVRSLIAHIHAAAPAELVIEVFIAEPRNRALLLLRPQMPRTGLAHLLDHPDPQVRALASADVTLPEPPVAMLDDADEQVRRAADANQLLPADVVERLLQDPRHGRRCRRQSPSRRRGPARPAGRGRDPALRRPTPSAGQRRRNSRRHRAGGVP